MAPTGGAPNPVRRGSWLRDWRFWLGLSITLLCVWYMLSAVPLQEVREALASANIAILLAISVPAYVLSLWVRALRWRHLTNPIASIGRGALFRAAAVGFMVNNLLPLRVGELVRSIQLARETGTSTVAIFGTVVLERVADTVSLLLLASAALAWMGGEADRDGVLAQGARLIIPVALVPVLGLVVLRVAPEPFMRLLRLACRPLSETTATRIESTARRFTHGLAALSGGSHLFWIGLHSAVLWLILLTAPVVAGLLAFRIDLGSPMELLGISWIVLGATGVAVAIPSAPGFFGPYQLAFKEVLERFGVDPATALAIGLLVWVVFWVTFVVQGFIALRMGRLSLREILSPAGKDPAAGRR